MTGPDDALPPSALVVVAAGSGTRSGAVGSKVLLPLAGRPVLVHAVEAGARLPALRAVVVVVRPVDRAAVADVLATHLPDLAVTLVDGGATRQASEQAALDHLAPLVGSGEVEVVAVHDGARPLAPTWLFARVVATAAAEGGCLPGVPRTSLVPRDPAGDRPQRLVAVQTPQAFRARDLLAAYAEAAATGFVGTDTAAVVERHTHLRTRWHPGDPDNLKITWPGDLDAALAVLAARRG